MTSVQELAHLDAVILREDEQHEGETKDLRLSRKGFRMQKVKRRLAGARTT